MRPSLWLATWGGVGRSPLAPGTMGTLGAIPLWLLFRQLSPFCYIAATLGLFALGWAAAERAEKLLGERDHPAIVVDEVVGFLVTMAGVEAGWEGLVLGFFLFRLADILKPPPVRWFDTGLSGGLGVMADDIVAGLYARAAMALLQFLGVP